jgi:four helix bundle protein
LRKSLDFAIAIVNYCKILKYKHKEYSLADQIVRSRALECKMKDV